MIYTIESHIQTVSDVEKFFHHFISERNLNFHPDNDFSEYICCEDKTSTFTEEEVLLYNCLMKESLIV